MRPDLVHVLSAQESGWTQIAVLGQFKDPRYGTFSITRSMVDSWKKNLSAVTGQPKVAIDYDHAADPSMGGQPSTRAAGWVTAIKLDGNRVLAQVAWTPKAEEAIRTGEYAFFSPTFVKTYRGEDGVDVGPTLLGGALTNRPHLRAGMRPVTLDAYAPHARGDSPAMTDFLKTLSQRLGLSEDSTEDQILQAIDGESGVKTLAQAAGLQVISKTEVVRLTQAATDGAAAVEKLREQTFETEFQKALGEGRVAPSQKDSLVKLYAADEDTTISLMQSAPPLVRTQSQGSGERISTGDRAEFADGEHDVDAEALALHQKIEARAKADGSDYTTAALTLSQEGVS